MRICPHCRRKYENAETRFCPEDGQPLVEQANFVAQVEPQTTVAERDAAPISASLMMAFFAHHFVELAGIDDRVNGYDTKNASTKVPCQPNVKVNSIKLAHNLLAISFWNLRENNLIRFAPGAERGFLSKHTPLLIEFNGANQTQIPGLEFDLMEIIKQSAPGVTAAAVVNQLLKKHTYAPYEKFFQRLTQWMIHLGYGQPDTSKKPFFTRGVAVNFELIPDCQRIMNSQLAAQIIHRKWMQFQTAQPDVYNFLYKAMDDIIWLATSRSSD
jgi:hypothetical protein